MKKKTNIFRIVSAMLIIMVATACQEKVEYPVEPYLEFQDFAFLMNSDSVVEKGLLTLYFTDGDGDIGLEDDVDTLPPYDLNLFIDYFEYRDGIWQHFVNENTGDTVQFHGRIPIITPSGVNKNISGTIEDTLDLNIYSDCDTFRYEVRIRDRALNESNIVVTPAFVMPE